MIYEKLVIVTLLALQTLMVTSIGCVCYKVGYERGMAEGKVTQQLLQEMLKGKGE